MHGIRNMVSQLQNVLTALEEENQELKRRLSAITALVTQGPENGQVELKARTSAKTARLLKARKPVKHLDEDGRAQLISMYRDKNAKVRDIAAALGVGVDAIYTTLRKEGVEKRRAG